MIYKGVKSPASTERFMYLFTMVWVKIILHASTNMRSMSARYSRVQQACHGSDEAKQQLIWYYFHFFYFECFCRCVCVCVCM